MGDPERVIRLGIVGCGRVAEERHFPSLLRLTEVRVVATADPDAVAVLTPTQSHGEIALAAMEAGKHVLAEKPLALSLAECDRLIEGAPGRIVGGRTVNALPDNVFSTASQSLLTYLYDYYSAGPNKLWLLASCNLALDPQGLRSVGGFDPAYPRAAAEDRDLCDRLRVHGYGMTYAPEAVVYHLHALTLVAFWRQHYGHGRGARRFRRVHMERSGEGVRIEPPRFYTGLPGCPFRQGVRRPGTVAALLVVSQIASAAGFFREWASQAQTAQGDLLRGTR